MKRVVQNEMKVLIKHKALLIAHHPHVQSAQMQSLAAGGENTLNSLFLPQSAMKVCRPLMKDVCSLLYL